MNKLLQQFGRIVIAALLAGPLSLPAIADTKPAALENVTLEFAGTTRHYLLYHPPGRQQDPLPLVVALHGGGGHAAHMADDRHYGLVAKAAREGFVLAFPNGYSRLPRGRLATWNAGGCCGAARDRHSDDVGFIRALVADVARRQPIDRERIFATGMSNGGMMAYRLACEAADLFRAVASVAGTEAVANCHPQRPVAVLHIHAQDDTHVLFDGGAGPEAFRDMDKVMDFIPVPETIRRWVARNACQPQPERTLERVGAWCERYRGCRDGAAVQLCVTATGGHSWPGASRVRRGKAPPSTALDANDTIWDFFVAVSRH